jgi:hypothetical protein
VVEFERFAGEQKKAGTLGQRAALVIKQRDSGLSIERREQEIGQRAKPNRTRRCHARIRRIENDEEAAREGVSARPGLVADGIQSLDQFTHRRKRQPKRRRRR